MLNNLTEEESRMGRIASETLEDHPQPWQGIQGVGRDAEGIVGEVQYVHDRVESVNEGTQDVLDGVQDVHVGLQVVGHGVPDTDHNVQTVCDKVVRGTSEIAFETGYHLRIRPQATTFCQGTTDLFTYSSIFNDWFSLVDTRKSGFARTYYVDGPRKSSDVSMMLQFDNIIEEDDSQIVQFSRYSVKEYLMSERFARWNSEVSCYHIQLEPAHTILAQTCLGVLL